MKTIDFKNKTFALITNSEDGTVDSRTTFKYQQDGNLVTADYFGGEIKYGKIIALLKENYLDMRYQCMTTEDELKAGKAIAQITINERNKIKLSLQWEWLDAKNQTGVSEYIEL